MLAIDVQVNILVVAALVAFTAIVIYLLRSAKIKSLSKKINDLEREMLSNHAEILQLQKEKIDLLKSMSQPPIPVIPINSAIEDKSEKLPDVSARKQLLKKPAAGK